MTEEARIGEADSWGGDTGTLETAVSVLSREGGCIPGHGGWVTLVPGHTHMTQGEYVYLYHPRLLYSVLSLPVTEGQVVGGATPGV